MKFTKKTISALTLGLFLVGNSVGTFASPLNNSNVMVLPISAEPIMVKEDKAAQLQYSSETGIITEVREIKGGIEFTIGEEKESKNSLGKVRLNVTDDTEIISSKDGKKLTKDDIKKGVKVKAYYGPVVTMSIPPMSNAKMVIIEDDKNKYGSPNYGTISEVYVQKQKNEINAFMNGEIETNLIINQKTTIIDAKTGKKLKAEDIKKGVRVLAYYDITTASLPPIACPGKVVVLSEKEQEFKASIKGSIEDINVLEGQRNEIMMLVKDDKGGTGINFVINAKTEIVNEKDHSKLTIDAIKKGAKVEVYYNGILTRSLPGIGVAEKIVVVQDECELGTIGRIEDVYTEKEKDEIRINLKGVKLEDNGFDEINLYVNEKTKIVDLKTGKELKIKDIKKNSIIVAYYGDKLTRSLPPMGYAEKIVVIK